LDGPMSEQDLQAREMDLRQRELALREQEMRLRQQRPRRPPLSLRNSAVMMDDEDDEDDIGIDPSNMNVPVIDPDTFDMMSVTSRKNRSKLAPSQSAIRHNPNDILQQQQQQGRFSKFRPGPPRSRGSQMSAIPMLGDNILEDPLVGCSSNRYGAVDRGSMQASSRANSMTAGAEYGYASRRTSNQVPGPYVPPGGDFNGPPRMATSQLAR
jgi:hypothetical protein